MPPIPEPGGNQRKPRVVAGPQECCYVRGPPATVGLCSLPALREDRLP